MLTQEQLEAYMTMNRWGVIREEHGYAAGLFVLGAELYVAPTRDRLQLQLDMLDVQEDYYRCFHEHLDAMQYYSKAEHDDKGMRLKKGENPFPMVRDSMEVRPLSGYTNVLWTTEFRHPDFPDREKFQISPWESEFFIKNERDKRITSDKELAYYASSIPVASGSGSLHFELLRECVLTWAKRLRPNHGLAGLSIKMSEDTTDRPYIYPTLKKYIGLDVHAPLDFSMEAGTVYNRIKCVNWLTVLGDEIMEELGGLAVLKKVLEPECTLYPYPGGVLIQAGEAPRLGNTDAPGYTELIEPYRKVAAITKRVRFMSYDEGLLRVPEALDDKEETLKWVSRFD